MAIFLESGRSLSGILHRASSGAYSALINRTYSSLKLRDVDDKSFRSFKSQHLPILIGYQREIKEAMSDSSFDDVRSLVDKKFERIISIDNKTEQFHSYPNKFSAYQDLKFYYDRITVLKVHLNSKY